MRFMHLSDLHLGKRLGGYSLLDDQKYILAQILGIIDEESPDAVLIAGDIYDKPVPAAEAVTMFDDFLFSLLGRNKEVYIIAGNHDSAERISFGSRIMERQGIHFTGVFDGTIVKKVIYDKFGPVNIYCLPYIRPAGARRFFEDAQTYQDMMEECIRRMETDENERNILMTHQFVTGAQRSESEEIAGGAESISAEVFECFDYVALGHLHRPQRMIRDEVRYCGTPLKYSFSEAGHVKSVTVVDMEEKGNVRIREIPLVPLHDMRIIRGSYDELTDRSYYENSKTEDYLQVILTDEEEVFKAFDKLSGIYPRIMKMDYDNSRTRMGTSVEPAGISKAPEPFELFARLYEEQNGLPMNDEQTAYVRNLIKELEEV